MFLRQIIRVSIILMLGVLLASCSDNNEQSAADLTFPVSVEKVNRRPIAEYISTTGTLRASREEQVVTEVDGLLHLAKSNGVDLSTNRPVTKGYQLAKLENPEYLLTVRVEYNKLAKENAKRELDKQEELFKEGGVTEKELEQARQEELRTRMDYESKLIQAEKLNLRAPISGMIANLQKNADGTRVRTGFVLCNILDYRTTLVDVNLPNTDLGRVDVGDSVLVSNYALEDEIFKGLVTAIDPTIDQRTRTFKVTVEIGNKDLKLRPGMFVKTDIVVASNDTAIVIPKEAILTRNNRPTVFVVEGNVAHEREVSTGIETREDVEISGGIKEGDQVVTKGHETLRDQSKVRVARQ